MIIRLLLVLCAVISIFGLLEAASLHVAVKNRDAVVQKLNFESVEANVRNARQAYTENDSGEDSDEDDEEDDAELQHQSAIRRQQAYEQSVDDSQEGSDEDNFDEDDDAYFGRRLKRDISETVNNNEIAEITKPTESFENKDKQPATETSTTNSPTVSIADTSNTSVLILIRDAIKKVTELPNTQQVTTSAQQYFQLFQHFLQQTIEQVIGDDEDDEDAIEATTIIPEVEKEPEAETTEGSDKLDEIMETSDKESSVEDEVPKPEKKPEEDAMLIKI